MDRRNTIQRALVLAAVKELGSHATADEVYAEIARKHPGIGRGTVYRNLSLLAGIGQIAKVEMPDGPDRYDHILDRHYHARCISCGRLFDVDMDVIPDLEKNIRDTRGFIFAGHDIFFKGTCRECKK